MPSSLTTHAIWVVDDDPDDQLLIKAAFRQLLPPVDIFLLNDGIELLESLPQAAKLPKVILLDLNMPRLNGFETLTKLRESNSYCSLPVVVLTTSTAPGDQQRALRLGANNFLTKPIDYNQLIEVGRQIVEQWL